MVIVIIHVSYCEENGGAKKEKKKEEPMEVMISSSELVSYAQMP